MVGDRASDTGTSTIARADHDTPIADGDPGRGGPFGRNVSAASASVFRIAFGIGIVVNALLYMPRLVGEYYVEPSYHFSYPGFSWVEPAPGLGMYAVYLGMVVCGGAIALGHRYRWAMGVFFLLTTYVFLLDSTHYQNHEYLISLLALLMLLMPLDRHWSLDARRRPEIASATIPVWVVWMLRFQIAVPYFYGGLAKLNGDWFRGEPLRSWLANRTDIEPIHSVLTDSSVVWMMTYGALILDLVIVPLLLIRRTRLPMFVIAVAFHLMNAWLFGLYIFPWLMIAATTIFFHPDWPLVFARRVRANLGHMRKEPLGDAALPATSGRRRRRLHPALAAFLGIWIAVQIVVPLRHLAITGNPSWTEEGHRFAWHMMLRNKTGTAIYEVETGDEIIRVDPRDHLTAEQSRHIVGHPQRLVQFAHHLSSMYDDADVRVITDVSMNGRARQPLIDPTIDLTHVPTSWIGHREWILPLTEPLTQQGAEQVTEPVP
jgi:vitamin K-dependent gamma-carboxylase